MKWHIILAALICSAKINGMNFDLTTHLKQIITETDTQAGERRSRMRQRKIALEIVVVQLRALLAQVEQENNMYEIMERSKQLQKRATDFLTTQKR